MTMISRKMGALMAASLSAASLAGLSGMPRMPVIDDATAYVPSSKNGGRKIRGNRHVQRAAAKKRNVRRFRASSRGRR